MAIYAVVVLLAPHDVLEQFSMLRRFSDAVRQALLSISTSLDIHSHARTTAFPQVAMLASALGLVLAGLIAVLYCLRTLLHYRFIRHLLVPIVRQNNALLPLVVAPMLSLFCLWAVYCVGGDWSMTQGLTTSSRLGYLLISSGVVAFAGIVFGTWPAQMRATLFDRPTALT